MRRCIVLSILFAVVVFSAGVSSAADDQDMRPPMMGRGMRGGMGMCPMHCMMMKSMTEKSVVATNDGGVVILAGNKLMKYDKNLELKKEVEIKCDMKKMCEEMCKDCPMCKEMEGCMEMKGPPAQEKPAQPASKAKR